MKLRTTINSTKLLTVEGNDEVQFFNAFLRYENIEKIQLWDVGGKDNFKNKLS